MKDTSLMYKVAILLAIGAGTISVTQSHLLRTELRDTRLNLQAYEEQMGILQKERLIRTYENGYKACLIDIYNSDPKYLITKGQVPEGITLWKKGETINPSSKVSQDKKEN